MESLRRSLDGLDELCQLVILAKATLTDVCDVFDNPRYANRIAIFHFGGHADSYELLFEGEAGKSERVGADGLATFLGQQRGLQLVFLNGCSTQGHVEKLCDAGIPAVISTSRIVKDSVAMEVAARFYKGLAGGKSILVAYKQSEAHQWAKVCDRMRDTYLPDVTYVDRWPWDITVRSGAECVNKWNLPEAAGVTRG
jgi:hypothetical protein